MNPGWEPEHGGELQLWPESRTGDGKVEQGEAVRIAPHADRHVAEKRCDRMGWVSDGVSFGWIGIGWADVGWVRRGGEGKRRWGRRGRGGG